MKSLLQIVCCCMLSLSSLAQSVTILPGGITPAMAGSIPTLTNEQIEALPAPSFGSLVNDLTFKCLRYYDGKKWTKVLTGSDQSPTAVAAWAESGNYVERGYDIKTDAEGNIYLTGIYYQTLTIGNKSVTSTGSSDIFLAKYDKNGNILWLKSYGNSVIDNNKGIELDADGNIYMIGPLNLTINFGNISLTSSGNSDMFIVKFDTNGETLWAQKGGGVGSDKGKKVVVSASGEVYVAGEFQNTAFLGNTSITSAGGSDIFIAKYATDGTLQWVKSAGGTGNDYIESLAVDNSKNVYVTGNYLGTMSFGNNSVTSAGDEDIFLAKYDPLSNTWAWAGTAGGTGYDNGTCIAINSSGRLIIAGVFENKAKFENSTIESTGEGDVYIAEYTTSGSTLWVRREGGKGAEYGVILGLDSNNNIYISGSFYGLSCFGSTLLNNNGSSDIFIAKLNSYGVCQWAQKAGSEGSDDIFGMTVKANGEMFLTGAYIGRFQMAGTYLQGENNQNLFVVRLKE